MLPEISIKISLPLPLPPNSEISNVVLKFVVYDINDTHLEGGRGKTVFSEDFVF